MPFGPKILIVDDEELIADTLVTILNQSGYRARAVYSGEDALAAADSFAPDLMVCDVVMSGLNGVETAILMRTSLPKIKILLFSGTQASVDLLVEARQRGHSFEFLRKPVHPKDLLRRLGGDNLKFPSGAGHNAAGEMALDSSPRNYGNS